MRNPFSLYLVLAIIFVWPALGHCASLADSEIHVQFCKPSQLPKSVELKRFPWKFKDWTPAEVEIVRSTLKEIHQTTPGLLSAAACGSDLYFVRVESLLDERYPKRVPGGPAQPSAVAGSDYILVGDQYFEEKYAFHRLHGLTHELVHVVDLGDYLSYSPEWSKFAEPIITKYLAQYTAQKLEMRSSFVALLSEGGVCPSAYASSDLREAFAEFYVASKFDKFDAGAFYKTHFADNFLSVSQQRIDFHKHIRAGDLARLEKNYENAIKEFKLAENLAPNLPSVQVRLAIVYQDQKDYERCFQASGKALRLLEQNGVSDLDPVYQYVEKEGEWAYAYVYRIKHPKAAPPLKGVSSQSVEDFVSGKSKVLNGFDSFDY